MEQKYDFYGYGFKVAEDNKINIEKLMAELEQRYGKKAKEDFERGYMTSMKSALDFAKMKLAENSALQQADQIDRKVANNEYNEELKRRGMI